MKNLILVFLISIPTFLFGQKTKKIKDKENDEVYYVLGTNQSIKHGEYKKLDRKGRLLLKGFYYLGTRSGIWESYTYGGELFYKYDYTKDSLLFLRQNKDGKKIKHKIVTANGFVDTTLTRPPVFLEGEGYLYNVLIQNLQYPKDAKENEITGTVIVEFVIDKYGKASNYNVKNKLGYGLDEEAIRVLKLLPNTWLPGKLGKDTVNVIYFFPIKFSLGH